LNWEGEEGRKEKMATGNLGVYGVKKIYGNPERGRGAKRRRETSPGRGGVGRAAFQSVELY
jgi:hypothetical protein